MEELKKELMEEFYKNKETKDALCLKLGLADLYLWFEKLTGILCQIQRFEDIEEYVDYMEDKIEFKDKVLEDSFIKLIEDLYSISQQIRVSNEEVPPIIEDIRRSLNKLKGGPQHRVTRNDK